MVGPTLDKIAILRLDGDWYESTKVYLEHSYVLVSPDGTIILDDYYGWEGDKQATDKFRKLHGINSPIIPSDVDAGYWVKES